MTTLHDISKKLTEKDLENALKVKFGDDIKFESFVVTPNSNVKGDSYLSEVFRLNVFGADSSGKKYDIPVIIKILPTNVCRRKTYRCTDFFKNELYFYTKIWPELKRFQESRNCLTLYTNVPLFLGGLIDGENDFVMLENVSPQGYDSVPRSSGLNREITTFILQQMAKFHALSFAFHRENPEKFAELVNNQEEVYFSTKLRWWYDKFFSVLTNIWSDALEREKPGVIYETKFKQLTNNDLFGKIIECVENNRTNKNAVFTHGDTWIPNFLVKFASEEKKTLSDCIIIDYQLVRPSSVSFDLIFFLFTCTSKTLRDECFDELLQSYHRQFSTCLEHLGVPASVFTFEQFMDDFKANIWLGFGMTMEATPMSMLDDSELSDLDNVKGNEAVELASIWLVKPFKDQAKRKRIVETFVEFVDRGFL